MRRKRGPGDIHNSMANKKDKLETLTHPIKMTNNKDVKYLVKKYVNRLSLPKPRDQ